jgi:transcriptional regulator with XRE-family HTH domain
LTLRELAARAGTSHSTLSAYENGRVEPGTDTLERIARAAGFTITLDTSRRFSGDARARELLAVLDLAAEFPARHSPTLRYPPFGRTP